MTFSALLLRNLVYHWRGNLAVFLGIALGSAVLTGALLVGDSLRGSLQALTLDQLGWIDEALIPGRFFRDDLALSIAPQQAAAALLLQGSASRRDANGETQRAGKVNILGVDAFFWRPDDAAPLGGGFWYDERGVVLNRTLAGALGASPGDTIELRIPRAGAAPGELILGKRKAEDVIEIVTVTVSAIIPDVGMARFSLKPTPEPVRNVFIPIGMLQKRLDLERQANAIFFPQLKSAKQIDLSRFLALEDWGLRFLSPKDRAEAFLHILDPRDFDQGKLKKLRWAGRVPDELAQAAQENKGILTREAVIEFYERRHNYFVLESRRMILEPLIVHSASTVVTSTKAWEATELSIYLADSLTDGHADVPYAVVAGIDSFSNVTTVISRADLLGQTAPSNQAWADDEIVLVDWPGSLLKVEPFNPARKGSKVADSVTLKYYSPDEKNRLILKEQKFKVKAVVKLEGKLDDPELTPAYPGVTDKLDIASWQNPPFPFNSKRVKKADEEFWKRYRATPKAYVTLEAARKLWGSRFGDVTSILLAKHDESPETFPKKLLAALKPEQGGFVIQPVRQRAIDASSGSTPFGLLFLMFSIFLIASALLLVGLLVRLNLDRRAGEMGLLFAVGWDHGRVRRLLLGEAAILAVVGSLVGLGGATLYGDLMVKFLAANWPGGSNLNFLRLHVEPESFAYGYGGSLAVSLLTLLWATRVLRKMSPRSLLLGETMQTVGVRSGRAGWSWWLIPTGVVGALALAAAGPFLQGQEAQAGTFFTSGALLLTACLALVWNGFRRSNRVSSPQPTLALLGMRNAGRHAVRSVLTVGLLASASFVVVAVECFHKDTDSDFSQLGGGSGGFAFYAEGNIPVFEDLNQDRPPELAGVVFYPCRVQPGDDASCLNLYKPLKPRVLGISNAVVQRGGFHFAATAKPTDSEKKNPWLLLQREGDAKDDAIPAIVDANTAQWILNVKLGGLIDVNNDRGESVKLRVVALLEESIFQSEVLVSEANFLKLFPRQEGFSFFLIDTGDTARAHSPEIEKQLGKNLDEFGLDVQTTASRLQGYMAVENTYLATFQALGGLGLILGALGLAIVLLRGVWERRAELALLRALGFRSSQLAWLVLAENVFLLLLGLVSGTVSALLAVAPHLVGMGAQVLWFRIAVLLMLVLAVGFVAATLAVWSTLRAPVLAALRRE